jgi:hypothetical protein
VTGGASTIRYATLYNATGGGNLALGDFETEQPGMYFRLLF